MRPTTFAEIFDLEQVDDDLYRASTPAHPRPDIFGGQVAGQALWAAARSVLADQTPNSVHCYFLRAGRPDLPIDLVVERTRTGRTYANRSVQARQDDKVIFSMMASFHAEESGREHEMALPDGVTVPGADDVPEAPLGGWEAAFEIRRVGVEAPRLRYWIRLVTPFPSDPVRHACALLYASDLRTGRPAMRVVEYQPFRPPEGDRVLRPGYNFGTLDHALWFHRMPRIDQWLLLDVAPLTVRDSRGLSFGTIHDAHGLHVATVIQEMFLKRPGSEE